MARAVITAKVMNGNAALALSLIKYDPDIKPIMQHIFGNTVKLYFLSDLSLVRL